MAMKSTGNSPLNILTLILVSLCLTQNSYASDSWAKESALNSFNSDCEFNPADNTSYIKVLSDDEELVERPVNAQFEAYCADDVLTKFKEDKTFNVFCRPFIEIDSEGRQILHYYWNLTELHNHCGRAPVCALMARTYHYPILSNSSVNLLFEDEVTYDPGNGINITSDVAFYPIGAYQVYDLSDDICGNDSLTVAGETGWSLCEGPDDLAILGDDDDPELMRTNFWFFNYGLWSEQPPECVVKECNAPDLTALGFQADDVVSGSLDLYQLGNTLTITCAEGQTQPNLEVTSEVITCALNTEKEAVFQRLTSNALRLGACEVRRCDAPDPNNFEGNVVFSDNRTSYNFGETLNVTCAEGSRQNITNVNVDIETISCDWAAGVYFWKRSTDNTQTLNRCQVVLCSLPSGIDLRLPGEVNLGTRANVTCMDINVWYETQCVDQEEPSTVGRWVPTPTCESKTCRNFMSDENIYEYELQYRRNIVGEPGPVEFGDNLTFVCPKGTVAYGRNELTYQCRIAPNGLGHFEPLDWDAKPDCREITCPRQDPETAAYFDFTYPHYERRCDEEDQCRIGMIMSLDCTAVENDYRPFYQCLLPADPPKLALNETELEAATSAGVWFPKPSCNKGCAAPINITADINCTVNRDYSRGEWSFENDYVINCTCSKGYVRDEDDAPQVQCDGQTREWTVIKSCRVDCDPSPIIENGSGNVSYFGTYAVMEISCNEGYRFFPTRSALLGDPSVECHLGRKEWINLHLWKCEEIGGCTEAEVVEQYPDIYIEPDKNFYEDKEVVAAVCNRGYFTNDVLFEVLACKAIWRVVEQNVTWSLIDTSLGPHPAHFEGFRYLPNVTMEFVGYEWDFQHVLGNLTCTVEVSAGFNLE